MRAFECKMCGQCCKGEGGVYVTREELHRIAAFLHMSDEAFDRAYCLHKNGRIYIRTGENGFCSLFNQGCTVHPVKPLPCKEWPFFSAMLNDPANWEVAKNNCPGVNPDCTYEEFRAEGLRQRKRLGLP